MNATEKVILLVEDNAEDVTLTLRALRYNNLLNPIAVVHDGLEALDFLFGRGRHAGRTKESLPTMVISDLNLPKLDGLGVLKAIRSDERTASLPVVLLTSSTQDEDVIRGYALGANSYVRKPVDFTEFLESVKALGMYWLMVNGGGSPAGTAQ